MEDLEQRAAQRYITGEESLRAIAADMGIPQTDIFKWSRAGGWAEKRKKAKARALKKAVTIATTKKARELARLIEASGEVERALLYAARAVAREFEQMEPDENGEISTAGHTAAKMILDGNRAFPLESIAKSIEKIASARNMLGFGMTQADEEKLKLLQRKQKLDEKKQKMEEQKEKAGGVSVQMDPALEDLSQ